MIIERHEEVLVALRRIIRAVDLHSKRLMQSVGLSGPQLVLLKTLAREGPLTTGRLARLASLSQGTISAILDRLERRGFTARTRSESDRREVVVTLTDEGRRTVGSAPDLLQESFIQSFKGLADWEQTQLLASLQRLAQMMDAADLDASPYLETRPLDGSWEAGEEKRGAQTAEQQGPPAISKPRRRSGGRRPQGGPEGGAEPAG